MSTTTVKKPRATRAKTASASAKSTPTHQTHGAVTPAPVDMRAMFGIKSVYAAKDIDSYRSQLKGYTVGELHAHAHDVGVLPMDPKEKLVAALERKFLEIQSKSLPLRIVPSNVTPEGQEFIKKFMAGTLR